MFCTLLLLTLLGAPVADDRPRNDARTPWLARASRLTAQPAPRVDSPASRSRQTRRSLRGLGALSTTSVVPSNDLASLLSLEGLDLSARWSAERGVAPSGYRLSERLFLTAAFHDASSDAAIDGLLGMDPRADCSVSMGAGWRLSSNAVLRAEIGHYWMDPGDSSLLADIDGDRVVAGVGLRLGL